MSILDRYIEIPLNLVDLAGWNYKTEDDDLMAALVANIKRNGQVENIIVRELGDRYEVVNGNHRVQAFRAIGMATCVAYNVGKITQRAAQRLAVETNETGFDRDKARFAKLMADIAVEVPVADLALTMPFSEREITGFLHHARGLDTSSKPGEDVVPEAAPKRCKPGQVWTLGRHRVMVGDSTSEADVDRLVAGSKLDITFTSPPYNAGTSAKLSGNKRVRNKGNLYGDGHDDAMNAGAWLDLVTAATRNSLRVSRYAFWNIQFLAGNRSALPAYWGRFADETCDVAIWNKGHGAPQQAQRVMNSAFEFVFVFTSDKKPTRAVRVAPDFRGTVSNVFDIAKQNANEFAAVHGATFPVALPETFIRTFAPHEGTVLDLFGGTGTTLIAAEATGRTAYLMEIDPRYADIVLERWARYTGQTPVLAD